MKKSFFLFALICFSTVANAQFFTSGIKAGVNLGHANIKEAKNQWEGNGLTTGVHAGYFLKLQIGPIFVQPEAYYTFTAAKLKKGEVSSGQVPETYDIDFHRLDVPLLAGFYIAPNTRINLGPFASVLIDAKAESSNLGNQSMEEYADDLYNRSVWGWQAGIGFDLMKFTLDARYETTVGDLRDQDFNNPSLPSMLPNEQSQRQFVFSLGYKF